MEGLAVAINIIDKLFTLLLIYKPGCRIWDDYMVWHETESFDRLLMNVEPYYLYQIGSVTKSIVRRLYSYS